MELTKITDKINTTKKKTITIDKVELKKAFDQSFIKGQYEEKKWHEDNMATVQGLPPDDFYSMYDAKEEVHLGVYSESDKTTAKKGVLESMTGMRVTRTGETLLSSNKYLSQEQLWMIQDASYIRAHTDPLGISASRNKTNFIIGKGIDIDCIIPEIEIELNKIRKMNNFAELERQIVKHVIISGEFFVKIKDKKKAFYIYGVSPSNVIEIEHDKQNLNLTLAYKIIPVSEWDNTLGVFGFDDQKGEWFPSIKLEDYDNLEFISTKHKGSFKVNEFVHFIKDGNFDELRGNPSFRGILRPLRYAEDFTTDRMRLNHERSKVILVKSVTGQPSGATEKPQRLPQGGIMLIATDNIKYEFLDSYINADDAKEDGSWIIHTISAGCLIPPHILQQRSDEAVYASIKKMETPFSQDIATWQTFFEENFLELYKFLIKRLVKKRILKPKYKVPAFVQLSYVNSKEASLYFQELDFKISEMVLTGATLHQMEKEVDNFVKAEDLNKKISINTEDIPINIIFPSVISDNPLEMAKVFYLYRKMGFLSLATCARKAGFDWRTELWQRLKEKSMNLDGETLNEPTKDPNPTGDNDMDGDPSVKMSL